MKQVQDTSPILKDQKSGFIQYSGHEAEFHSGNIHLYQMDCMELLKQTPDKYYELSIVDPPYGIGMHKTHFETKSSKSKASEYGEKKWDVRAPDENYFNELRRISKNQIIWGANHFISKIPFDSSCWVVWDKDNGGSLHADCELAYTSFETSVRRFKYTWHGMRQENMKNKEHRIHPTQKPVALYKWLLTNYAKPGDRILDTHGGSRSLAIACHQMGFDHVSCELDKYYHEASVKRFKEQTKQLSLL